MSAQRSPEEIRASIEANRAELAVSMERLRGEVAEVTDWRKQIREHQQEVLIGAAVAGFVIGGGIAGVSIAYELSKSVRVSVLEMESTLAYHTTGRSAATFLSGARSSCRRTARSLSSCSAPIWI